MAKRLVFYSDGTWNSPDKPNQTNVRKLYEVTAPYSDYGEQKLKCYDPGVGTEGNRLQRWLGGFSGTGLDKNILDGYQFLAENHEVDDEIFLIGFSRGAYTSRSLVGLVHNCGILKPEHASKIDYAMSLYRSRKKDDHPYSERAQRFRDSYSNVADIKFLGIWDTVGSLGIPLQRLGILVNWLYRFHDVELSGSVKFAYHALAIDEKRGSFKPSIWEDKGTKEQTVEQV